MINTFKADPKDSSAHFNLKNTIIPDVEGDFKSLSGSFIYDPDKLENSSIEAFIDVKSVSTGSPSRDKTLKGKEFFNVQKFPEIKFYSKKIEALDEDVLKVTGDLTVKNITRNIILNVERPDQLSTKRLHIVASTLINREEFNLELGSVLEVGEMLVGDNIQIIMDIALIKQS